MELLNQTLLVLAMIVSLLLEKAWWCHGCLDQERDALLQIKTSFNIPISTPWPPYPLYYYYPDQQMKTTWERDSNCCNWEMLECNNITGRVTGLYLWEIRAYLNLEEMYLNASLFLPFEELKELYLDGNKISGCIENEGFERLSRLSKLEVLDLYNNKFNNIILSSFKGLSSLKYLNLGYNQLKGVINLKELDTLNNLQELSLSGNEITKIIASTDDHGLRNLSILELNDVATNGRKLQLQSFEALPNLKTLYLNWNNFEGAIFGQELQNLEELFLDQSSFDESALQSLGALPSLKHLSMMDLSGALPSQGFPNLKQLEHLELSSSTANDSLMQTFGMLVSLKTLSLQNCNLSGTQGFSKLKKLENLDLSYSVVNNEFLDTVGMLTSLKALSLVNCSLSGTLPTIGGLCVLKHLKELRMKNNDLSGTLPWCFANLISLELLDLSSNHFIGNISLSPIATLTSIQYLSISKNKFQVPLSLRPLFNHSKLKTLNAQNNEIYVEKEEMHNLTPKFQLECLMLSSYNLSNAKKFPEFLRHQHDLQYVDLSHIGISGSGFPYWLLENNTDMQLLLLVANSLSGSLQLPSLSHTKLCWLDISGNSFHGHIPYEFGTKFPRLGFLNMSQNAFNGSIPSSMGKMTWLLSLDMSNNRLSGPIPESLAARCPNLYVVILSNNSLEGQIFSKNFKLRNLEILLLDENNFTGGIPESLFNSSWLTALDIRNNSLSGNIPMWMANMSSLKALDLSYNHISGTLSSSFCPSSLTEVYLSNNQLQGSLYAFVNCFQLETIDLSHNYFTGKIPEQIGGFSQLNYLVLGHNNFKGEIPNQLCKLEHLRLVDLSNNNFSGHILPCLRTTRVSSGLQESSSIFAIAHPAFSSSDMEQSLEFTTKSRSYSYSKLILFLLSGIDLSSNNLVGEIPLEIGNLNNIQVLNLSHNNLTGSIPSTFSNLRQIESLDLSYNKLDGQIPPQLVELFSLSVFSVAHNNLSGKTPDRIAQFATFDKDSYEGNPFLCGLPLQKSCTTLEKNSINDNTEQENGFIDMQTFYVCFIVSYITVLIAIAAVLFINPYWRQRWLYFIEMRINSCYYFFIDNFCILSKFKGP